MSINSVGSFNGGNPELKTLNGDPNKFTHINNDAAQENKLKVLGENPDVMTGHKSQQLKDLKNVTPETLQKYSDEVNRMQSYIREHFLEAGEKLQFIDEATGYPGNLNGFIRLYENAKGQTITEEYIPANEGKAARVTYHVSDGPDSTIQISSGDKLSDNEISVTDPHGNVKKLNTQTGERKPTLRELEKNR